MDFRGFSLSGMPFLERLSQTPETLIAAFVSASATLALIVALGPRLTRTPAPRAARSGLDAGSCDFRIDGTSAKAVSEPARALLASFPRQGSRLAAIGDHLAPDCPGIRQDIEALVLYGTGFRHHCPRGDGTAFEVVGAPTGTSVTLSIRPASEDARALQDSRNALARADAETRFLREIVDNSPVAAWSMTADGQVSWANAAYRDRFNPPGDGPQDHRIPNAFGHVLEEVPLTARGEGLRRRVSIPGRRDTETHWFEVSQVPGAGGETLGFALPADELVAAEASLRRFVETLTETFAHLPIGLAVFDKNRRLGLFNPALTDLVKIDAVWLAGRPSLRDFLERLRETRQMPEQKDFAAWRRSLSELEEGARDGTYEQHWELPSGKVFRVTGRPHPQGALAFLFEDISTAIQLERKYRSELELSQATLDRMAEAVAVFDASGMLVFVNSAFEALWDLDPMGRLEGPGVAEMTRLCAERCAPTEAWAQMAEFATGAESRTAWTTSIRTLEGRLLSMLVAPLPDASSLVVFRDTADETREAGHAALRDLALEQIRMPVETAVSQLMAAIPSAQSADAFKALSAATQGLKDGLARSRELHGIANRADAGAGPLPDLAAILSARGLSLEASTDAVEWDARTRRAALALGIAVADLAAPSAKVSIIREDTPEGARLIARAPAPAAASGKESVGVALARRLIEAAGGKLTQATADGACEFVVALPAEHVLALPAPENVALLA